MSDYISKSALIEDLKNDFCADCTECGGHCRHDDLFETVEKQLTISETEIIRKPFERVVERLEKYKRANDMCRENAASAKRHENVRYFENLIFATEQAISMVKEEGGIQ